LRAAVSFDTQNETSDPSLSTAYGRVEVEEDEGKGVFLDQLNSGGVELGPGRPVALREKDTVYVLAHPTE